MVRLTGSIHHGQEVARIITAVAAAASVPASSTFTNDLWTTSADIQCAAAVHAGEVGRIWDKGVFHAHAGQDLAQFELRFHLNCGRLQRHLRGVHLLQDGIQAGRVQSLLNDPRTCPHLGRGSAWRACRLHRAARPPGSRHPCHIGGPRAGSVIIFTCASEPSRRVKGASLVRLFFKGCSQAALK